MTSRSITRNQQGFALLEVLVSIAILALVGLMAWRGMDGLIRASEMIQGRGDREGQYIKLVNQFERDCAELVEARVVNAPPVFTSEKAIWLLRSYRSNGADAFLLVAYVSTLNGLQRQSKQLRLNQAQVNEIWQGALQNPHSIPPDFDLTFSLQEITAQQVVVHSVKDPSARDRLKGLTVQWQIQGIRFPLIRSCPLDFSL